MVRPRHHAFQHIPTRLGSAFCDVDLACHSPLTAVRGAAGALGTLLNTTPMADQPFNRHLAAAHRNPAALACDLQGAGFEVGPTHGDGWMRYLQRFEVDAKRAF